MRLGCQSVCLLSAPLAAKLRLLGGLHLIGLITVIIVTTSQLVQMLSKSLNRLIVTTLDKLHRCFMCLGRWSTCLVSVPLAASQIACDRQSNSVYIISLCF